MCFSCRILPQEEISELHRGYKPFKAAYTDLKTMGKGALARGQKAVEQALKTRAEELQQASLSTAATATLENAKKRRVAAATVEQNMFSLRHTACVPIPTVSPGADLKPLDDKVSIDVKQQPCIFRVPPDFLQQAPLQSDVELMRTSFAGSASKATTGRATQTASQDFCCPRRLH